MPPLNTDLTRIQFGLEDVVTPGTLVAATRLVPATAAAYQRMQNRENLDEMRGIQADYEDVLTRRYSQLEMTQVLDFENLIPALMCGLENETPSGADPTTWTFTPGRAGPVPLRTASIEIVQTDGRTAPATKHTRFGAARPTSISIAIPEDGYGTIQTTWMGRRAVALANPAAVTALARTPISADLFEVQIDDSWSALGTTDYGQLRSANIEINPGLSQAFTKAGRADLDPAGWYRSRPTGIISLTINHDAAGTGELGHFDSGDLRFVRLSAATGSGAGTRLIQIDATVRYIETPDEMQAADRQHTLEFQGHFRADATTANNLLSVEVQNGLAAW